MFFLWQKRPLQVQVPQETFMGEGAKGERDCHICRRNWFWQRQSFLLWRKLKSFWVCTLPFFWFSGLLWLWGCTSPSCCLSHHAHGGVLECTTPYVVLFERATILGYIPLVTVSIHRIFHSCFTLYGRLHVILCALATGSISSYRNDMVPLHDCKGLLLLNYMMRTHIF